jgi:transposase
VDHLGLIISGVVGAASCTDRDGLDVLCYFAKNKKIQLPKKVYADLGYSGEDMKLRLLNYGIELETVGRRDKKTFIVEPKRWIVERTFAWLGKFRRHSKDYELITSTSIAMIYLAMSRLMVARLSVL